MMKQWVFVGVLTLLLVASSCGTSRVVSQDRYVYVTDTCYRDVLKIDSVFVKDSIYIREKADTVFFYKDRYEYKYIYLRDTSYVAVHDSIYIEKEIAIPVEKELTLGQKVRQKSFWWLLAGVLGLSGWTFRKPIWKLIKRII